MLKRPLALCAGGLLLAATLLGADVSGIWTGQLADRNGDLHDLSFRFKQTGDTLAGKMYGDNESTPIAGGKVLDRQIVFSVKTEQNGQISTFIYSGTIDGDEIKVTREREPAPAGNTSNKPTPKQSITLKRLT